MAKWMPNTTLAQQHSLRIRLKRSHETSKSSFCEFGNKRIKCRNVEDLSGKQNEGREWMKSHLMPWAEASFRWKRQKRWDQMTRTATRADTHFQKVWVTINRLIIKTKQAAIAVLMSSGIQAEEIWWNEAEFSIHRRLSGKIEQTKFIVRTIPNATLKELFVQMDSDLGCKVICNVRTIKEYRLNYKIMAFLSPRHNYKTMAFLSYRHFVCQELCIMTRSPPKWRKCESFRGNGLHSWRPERAMDRMDRHRTSIDERMLSGRRAVMIV